ncbi:MAG: Ig-like domain-containing protein [Owenweeksia sp.]|nr:Ig-like domain-containing protein [Owenweeksia sp.]
MQKISPWPLFSLLGFLVFLDFTTTSCASVSSPSGGPRDTISPKIDTSFPPNFTINFKSQKIQLIFSEYLQLKSPSQQITISPPLENKLQIEAQGKVVNLSWKDSLQSNTTYTISFGNAITDFTEGNVNDRFKYVFSTGSFIDSLQLSGSLTNSRTGQPEKELLVALYDWSQVKHQIR